jgi:rare lipoprotein A
MPAAILWLILTLILTGCATARVGSPPARTPTPGPRTAVAPPPSTPRPPAPRPKGFEETGEASWYGRQHHGKRTASGETYDMHKLTAAHRTLPLGTRVLVTNLENDRTVEVRINDRGPFVAGRMLDLSYAAAQRLGAVGAGVISVRLNVLADAASGDPPERPPPPERAPAKD